MEHEHVWKPIKKGFPQRVCSCGVMAVSELKIGDNTITLSPGGSGDDTMRFSALGTPTSSGMTVDPAAARGRPVVNQDGPIRRVRMADEPISKKFWRFNQNAGTTTILSVNTTATITTVGTPANLNSSGAQFIDYSGAGDLGWANTSFNETQRQGDVVMTAVIQLQSIADVNCHVGFVSSDPFTTTPNMAAVRFNTGAGDTFWMGVTGNGASTTASSTGLAPAAGFTFLIRIQLGSGSPVFQVSRLTGSGSTSIGATTPSTTALLGTFARLRPLAGSKNMAISHVNITEGRQP